MELATKRFTVTGGSGFLGRYVVRELIAAGADPERIVVPRSKDYDLRQQDAVRHLYRDATPDVVIHLAARVGGIGANSLHPGRFFYDNLIMGAEVIEQGRAFGVEKVVTVGTICSYPKHTPVPFREEMLWDGYPEETNAPYGIAKKALLAQGQAYRAEFGMNCIHLLPVNLYGPGDNFDVDSSHVIPALMRKCVEARERGDEAIVCWGDGTATREFLYVADAARAIVLATERYDEGWPVNVGSGEEISIRSLAELVAEEIGFRGHIEWDASRPNGQPRRCVDTSLARSAFGFSASTGLRDGLRRTVGWYEGVRRPAGTGLGSPAVVPWEGSGEPRPESRS